MKKSSFMFSVLAVVFAIGAAFGAPLMDGYYGSAGTQGTVDQEGCAVQAGTICTIGDNWAFDSPEHAIANAGGTSNPSAPGLLKRP
ncbi:MAG TPA: hypothetical protein VFE57_07315 [Cyclobacteriaceae bacterium]|jgi:hypothetical protein|nr:hypothetical protein [Cyclobacteriaceae bacterium]